MSALNEALPLPAVQWHGALRRYFAVITSGNLVWEFLHMPLYTIWQEEAPGKIVFAAFHCTGGDILIALASLTISLLLVGNGTWPAGRFHAVAALTIALGLIYTIVSEWLNIVVRAAWAYSDLMPVVHLLGFELGVSPLLQGILVPSAAFWWARRATPLTLE